MKPVKKKMKEKNGKKLNEEKVEEKEENDGTTINAMKKN